MKKYKIIYFFISVVLFLSLFAGCVAYDPHYEESKARCFEYIIDNEQRLNELQAMLEKHCADTPVSIYLYLDEHSGDVVVDVSNDHPYPIKLRNAIIKSPAYSLAGELLQNEYIDCIGLICIEHYDGSKSPPTLSVRFIHFSPKATFYEAERDNGQNIPEGVEHITGDWYYFEMYGE